MKNFLAERISSFRRWTAARPAAAALLILAVLAVLAGWADSFSLRSRAEAGLANVISSASPNRVCTDQKGNKGYVYGESAVYYVDASGEALGCLQKNGEAVMVEIIEPRAGTSVSPRLSGQDAKKVFDTMRSSVTSYPFSCRTDSSGEIGRVRGVCAKY